MKKTIRISLIIIVVIFFIGFTLIFIKNYSKANIINIWTVDVGSRFDKYMEYIIDSFQKHNKKILVNWKDFSKDEIVKELYNAWHKDSLPDIITLETNILINKVNDNIFLDLKEYESKFSEKIFSGILNSNKREEKLLGIPWYANIEVLYVNKNIVKNLENIIENYFMKEKDFTSIFRNVKERFQKYGIVMSPESIKNLIFNGIHIIDSTGKVNINIEEVVEYFKKRQALFNDSIVPRKFLNFDDKLEIYIKGEVGIIDGNIKLIDNIEKISKEIYEDTVILPIPLGENNKRYCETTSLTVLKDSKNLEDSIKFIEFLIDESNQKELINNFSVLPINKNFTEKDFYVYGNSKKIQTKLVAYTSLENSEDYLFNINNYNEINNVIEKYSRTIYLENSDVDIEINKAQMEINEIGAN